MSYRQEHSVQIWLKSGMVGFKTEFFAPLLHGMPLKINSITELFQEILITPLKIVLGVRFLVIFLYAISLDFQLK